jgi:hypothetical protein
MRTFYYLSAIIAAVILISSCGEPNERQLYEKELKGISYKTYKNISRLTVTPAIVAYNMTSKDSCQVDPDYARLLLGYALAVTQKTNLSFAEANIVIEDSKDAKTKALAHLLLSIGMYEKGWKKVAKEESDIGMKELDNNTDIDQVKNEILIIHLLAGTVSVYDRNFDMARFHFAGIGQLTGVNWPYNIVDALGNIDSGNIQKGLVSLKKLSQDPSVPAEIRSALADLIKEVEKTTGNVESPMFIPRIIGKYLIDELKNSTSVEVKSLFGFKDDLKNKVSL